jgi:hypothetical protein
LQKLRCEVEKVPDLLSRTWRVEELHTRMAVDSDDTIAYVMYLAQETLSIGVELQREHWADVRIHRLTKGDSRLESMSRPKRRRNKSFGRRGGRTCLWADTFRPADRLPRVPLGIFERHGFGLLHKSPHE